MSSTSPSRDWCRPVGPHLAGGMAYRVTWPVQVGGLTVPPGFVFDASIPFGLRWWLCPHDARILLAAAGHDYALVQGHGRVRAAVPFAAALKMAGVGRWLRLAMVLAVIVRKWR